MIVYNEIDPISFLNKRSRFFTEIFYIDKSWTKFANRECFFPIDLSRFAFGYSTMAPSTLMHEFSNSNRHSFHIQTFSQNINDYWKLMLNRCSRHKSFSLNFQLASNS